MFHNKSCFSKHRLAYVALEGAYVARAPHERRARPRKVSISEAWDSQFKPHKAVKNVDVLIIQNEGILKKCHVQAQREEKKTGTEI